MHMVHEGCAASDMVVAVVRWSVLYKKEDVKWLDSSVTVVRCSCTEGRGD